MTEKMKLKLNLEMLGCIAFWNMILFFVDRKLRFDSFAMEHFKLLQPIIWKIRERGWTSWNEKQTNCSRDLFEKIRLQTFPLCQSDSATLWKNFWQSNNMEDGKLLALKWVKFARFFIQHKCFYYITLADLVKIILEWNAFQERLSGKSFDERFRKTLKQSKYAVVSTAVSGGINIFELWCNFDDKNSCKSVKIKKVNMIIVFWELSGWEWRYQSKNFLQNFFFFKLKTFWKIIFAVLWFCKKVKKSNLVQF